MSLRYATRTCIHAEDVPTGGEARQAAACSHRVQNRDAQTRWAYLRLSCLLLTHIPVAIVPTRPMCKRMFFERPPVMHILTSGVDRHDG